MYKTDKEYIQRVLVWEATKPQDIKVTVKENAMSTKYYTETVLL
jgi:hypothetical protein